MILQTLYQQCIKQGVTFFDEFHMLDLVMVDGECRGIVAIELATGELHTFHAKSVLIATGGFGRMFKVSSNAYALTGDGPAIAYRHGLPLEDLEFYQFHPTGIYPARHLALRSLPGRRRDHVQRQGRAVHGEVRPEHEGPRQPRRLLAVDLPGSSRRAGGRRQGLRLSRHPRRHDQQVRHQPHRGQPVDSHWVEKRLPDIIEFARTYLGVDPIKEPMPIQPTAHYAMGGIPTDVNGQVIRDNHGTVVPGLYSAGESACVSVHGANRLGTNSLVDLIVYGRRSGREMARHALDNQFKPFPARAEAPARAMIDALMSRPRSFPWVKLRDEMQRTMMDNCGVYRTEETLDARPATTSPRSRSNTRRSASRIRVRSSTRGCSKCIELGCLLDISEATVASALARKESRGAHSREKIIPNATTATSSSTRWSISKKAAATGLNIRMWT